jgi:anti-sigma factor RsiW
MMCNDITDLILDYLTEELDPDTTSEFEKHMRICPDCVAFLNTYKQTVQMTRSLRYEDIPPEMEKRVRQFLAQKMKGAPRRR